MRVITGVLAILFSLTSQVSVADEAASPTFTEGEHYQTLPESVSTSAPDKIEVVEIFAYTCGHCFNFAPLVSAWKQEQPDDVAFVQTPAMWNDAMETYARGFYTARRLDILDDVHMPVFSAIHQERKQFRNAEDWADFLSGYGVEEEEVLSTFNSFGITSQVRQADANTRAYRIEGTPEMVVDGKYRVSSRMTGSHSEMLRVVDYLVEQIRAGEL